MDREDLIPANEFCTYHHISYSFISSLNEAGLIEVTVIEEQQYLKQEQIKDLEKLVRLHTELDINPEGVEAIAHLLQRLSDMQQELRSLQQRLDLYEGEE
jgi:chaperone modulatory protein CbpM